jgi:hypothetical protein
MKVPWYQSLYWSIGWAAMHEIERVEGAALRQQHRRCCDTCRVLVEETIKQRHVELISELVSRFERMLEGRDAILHGNPFSPFRESA